jgi:hypothetical protein
LGRPSDAPIELVRLDWKDLQGHGILRDMPSGVATTSFDQRIKNALMPYGRRFVDFIETEAHQPDP